MGSINSVSIEMSLILYLCLCVKSVTLESNNGIRMQTNNLEYDNRFCF